MAKTTRDQGGSRPIVIGLAGGVGSGKSAVAAAFGRLGFVVVDADQDAKDLLDDPRVRERLVGWWGGGIVGEDDRVDRAAVAEIVFGSEAERKRLEGLVHPLVGDRRHEVIEQAGRDGVPGVVVDAPLLFEAGVDTECDWVVFVEAQAEVRRSRVVEKRGWSEDEWRRREGAQMGLAEKKDRSNGVIVNNGSDSVVLDREASRIYAIVQSEADARAE